MTEINVTLGFDVVSSRVTIDGKAHGEPVELHRLLRLVEERRLDVVAASAAEREAFAAYWSHPPLDVKGRQAARVAYEAAKRETFAAAGRVFEACRELRAEEQRAEHRA